MSQQLGLFDSPITSDHQSQSKTFDELRAEYQEKLALAGTEPYIHVYTQLLWCLQCGNPIGGLERKIEIANKILSRGSSEYYETQRVIYEQELSRFIEAEKLGAER